MTLTLVEPARITLDPRRYDWCPTVELPDLCCVPDCRSLWGLQRHHIIRRSATGGPLDYVTIDGVVVTNVARICSSHHDDLTSPVGGHRAAMAYSTGVGWVWCVLMEPGLTGDQAVCLSTVPAGSQVLFETARGAVWRAVGPLYWRCDA